MRTRQLALRGQRHRIATVYVHDQRRALDFYVDQLGFEMRRTRPPGDGRFVTVAFR